ncbi:MAG: metalloregulator ArsR/SmtB family transcription factor [Pseudomonadota bacterium]
MDTNTAIEAFGALAHETRMDVFRLLIQRGPKGMAAGEIAEELDIKQNTMSANLATLTRAGLIQSKRDGRSIIYRADFEGVRGLLAFLMEDCCGGRPELCAPASNVNRENRPRITS